MLSVIPEDRSKDAWIAAAWQQQEWYAPGRDRHPDPPEYIATYLTHEKASRENICIHDKQTTNWGWSVQSIHEEVGTGGKCGM